MGFGVLGLGFGFWVLGFGFWVLGFGFWVLGFTHVPTRSTAYLLPVGNIVQGLGVSTRGNNYTGDDSSVKKLLADAGLDTVGQLFDVVGKLR